MRCVSIPPSPSPAISASSSIGELSRPSRPTATRLPPASDTICAKARPIAWASAAVSVSPTTPRMSYSRRMVGFSRWPPAAAASSMSVSLIRSAVIVEDLANRRAHVGARQCEGNIGLKEADLVAAVEALAVEAQPVKRLVAADQLGKRVGKLDLIAGATADPREMVEHFGLQNVAADDAEIGGRPGRFGLFNHPPDADQLAVVTADVEHAVPIRVLARHLHHRDNIAVGATLRIDHLLEAGSLGKDEVVRQQHGEGLIAHQIARTPYRMTQAQRHLLAGIGDLARSRHPGIDDCDLRILVALAQRRLEFV